LFFFFFFFIFFYFLSFLFFFFFFFFFFFNDTATTEIYTLSLHDALPILHDRRPQLRRVRTITLRLHDDHVRSEEHTSELQSHHDLVCRLLLEKKKNRGRGSTEPPGITYVTPASTAGLHDPLRIHLCL